jgi:hypothetical protein
MLILYSDCCEADSSSGIVEAVVATWASAMATSRPLTNPASNRSRVKRALCVWVARLLRAMEIRWNERRSM